MTTYRVRPLEEPLGADVTVPGSKSIANRALVCAALADGVSVLRGIAPGDDTAAMLDCLTVLGVSCEFLDTAGGDIVEVRGCGGRFPAGAVSVNARLAGTTSRFVTAVAALADGPVVIDGEEPLRRRPMAPLHEALVALGAEVRPLGSVGNLPVEIRGGTRLDATAALSIRGDVSSQYITALMLIAPLLPGGLTITLTTELVSRSYVAITAAVMAAFGLSEVVVGEEQIVVPAGCYQPIEYTVEPDASSASYPLAAAAVVGGTVHVPGLTASSLQGDARFAQVLADMGCEVVQNAAGTTVTRHGPLRGLDIDMVDISDLVPTLAVVAPFATTATTIRGVGFIRAKESDRIGDLCCELRAAGIRATETDDGLVVEPGWPAAPVVVHTHHDHRLAMALALFGLVSEGVEIDDPGVVSKSWPEYWQMLEELS